MTRSSLLVRNLGVVSYEECWTLQRSLQQDLIAGAASPTLLLCSHPPVVTLGRSTKPEHLITSKETLEARGISVFDIERGGSVTYHGPEQLVAYPIIDLNEKRRDVGWYMRSLEETIIRTLSAFEISGIRAEGKTGVWVPSESAPDGVAKIAFIGVRISRWRTMHGISINVGDCSGKFALIDPCGLGRIEVTSMERLLSRPIPSWSDVGERFAAAFAEVFEYSVR